MRLRGDTEAPGAPGIAPRWTRGNKFGVGTAYSQDSPVWFTIWRGVVTEVGPDVKLITPGVRPAGADIHDQARVATPEEAIRAGADLLVIGRPITRAPDPGAAAAAVAASLRRAFPSTTPATPG